MFGKQVTAALAAMTLAASLQAHAEEAAVDAHAAAGAPAAVEGDAEAALPPVATVNGVAISPAELQIMVGTVLGNFKPSRRSDIDKAQVQAREELIKNLALAQEAVKLGLDKDPGVAGVIAYQYSGTLAKAYQRVMLRRNPVTEESIKAEYQRGLLNGKAQEYRLSQIVLAQKGKAEEVLQKLASGEKFDDMARIYSLDPTSSDKGGDLGWRRIDLIEDYPIVDAVTSLKPGEYTKAPVEATTGWHVIKLMEAPRPMPVTQDFVNLPDDVKDKLKRRATVRQLDGIVNSVMDKAEVTRAADLRIFTAVDSALSAPGNSH